MVSNEAVPSPVGRANAASARTVWRMLFVIVFPQLSSRVSFESRESVASRCEDCGKDAHQHFYKNGSKCPAEGGAWIVILACSKQRNV